MNKDTIHFILTGGTIDSTWNTSQDSIVLNKNSNIPVYFEKFPVIDAIECTQLCMKDSRQLLESDLENLVKTIEQSTSTKVIVTHGRFTVSNSARYVIKMLKRHDQTIIFTGGATPICGFDMSDSPFNLGFALAKVQDRKPGVYIVVQGKLFTPDSLDSYIQSNTAE